MKRGSVLLAGVVGAIRLLSSADARACVLPVLTPHVVDPALQASDQAPPRLPALLAPDVGVGRLSSTDASCGDVATFDLTALATDNVTPPEKIGYRLSLETGTPPSGLVLPTDAVEPNAGRHIVIAWPGPLSEPVADFTVRVVAIDAAGNESAPQLASFHRQDIGCGAVADPRPALGLLAWLFAAVARRRRRSSR